MESYLETNKLYCCTVRLPKEQAVFFYFILEANESLSFYSTLEESLKEPYRDIAITATIEFKDELVRSIELLSTQFPLQIIDQKEMLDRETGLQ